MYFCQFQKKVFGFRESDLRQRFICPAENTAVNFDFSTYVELSASVMRASTTNAKVFWKESGGFFNNVAQSNVCSYFKSGTSDPLGNYNTSAPLGSDMAPGRMNSSGATFCRRGMWHLKLEITPDDADFHTGGMRLYFYDSGASQFPNTSGFYSVVTGLVVKSLTVPSATVNKTVFRFCNSFAPAIGHSLPVSNESYTVRFRGYLDGTTPNF